MTLDEARTLGVGAKIIDPRIIGEGTITNIEPEDIGDLVRVEYPDGPRDPNHPEFPMAVWYDNDLENDLQHLQPATSSNTP
jgi:hypothetical protein